MDGISIFSICNRCDGLLTTPFNKLRSRVSIERINSGRTAVDICMGRIEALVEENP